MQAVLSPEKQPGNHTGSMPAIRGSNQMMPGSAGGGGDGGQQRGKAKTKKKKTTPPRNRDAGGDFHNDLWQGVQGVQGANIGLRRRAQGTKFGAKCETCCRVTHAT